MIMTISLLIPATLSVMVFVLLIRYNSANVIAKAINKKKLAHATSSYEYDRYLENHQSTSIQTTP